MSLRTSRTASAPVSASAALSASESSDAPDGPSDAGAVISRGHLNPGAPEAVFDRFDLDLPDVVRNVWVVRWSVEDVLTQRVLNYPAINVVVEADRTGLYGPRPQVGERELRGRGWAVGVLFRPAATPLLTDLSGRRLVGAEQACADAPSDRVGTVMGSGRTPIEVRDELREILYHWLAPLTDGVTDAGRTANVACRIAEERADILTAAELADQVHASVRTLERIVLAHTGFSPKQLIECRRMQHAAHGLFTAPDTNLADLAADLGFADHAHFTRRYRSIIGETPRHTRDRGRARTRPGSPATPRDLRSAR